jgi:SPP1 gp7 family putative phage head morphogenesis protein
MLTRTVADPFPEDPPLAPAAKALAGMEGKGSRRATQAWVSWNRKVRKIETAMTGKLRKWMMERRGAVLANLPAAMKSANGMTGKAVADFWPDSAAGIRQLFKLITPIEIQAIALGASQAATALGIEIGSGTLDSVERDVLKERLTRIGESGEKIGRDIRSIIADGLEAGDTEAAIADAIRQKFNDLSDGWSRVIARTEAGAASNGGQFGVFGKEGVEYIEWVSCRDADVRDSHADLDGVKVKMGETFANGLHFPCEDAGDAGEVVNCRCTFIVSDKEE